MTNEGICLQSAQRRPTREVIILKAKVSPIFSFTGYKIIVVFLFTSPLKITCRPVSSLLNTQDDVTNVSVDCESHQETTEESRKEFHWNQWLNSSCLCRLGDFACAAKAAERATFSAGVPWLWRRSAWSHQWGFCQRCWQKGADEKSQLSQLSKA